MRGPEQYREAYVRVPLYRLPRHRPLVPALLRWASGRGASGRGTHTPACPAHLCFVIGGMLDN